MSIVLKSRNDIFKFASAFLIQRLIAGDSVFDNKWISVTVVTIVGFLAYELLMSPSIRAQAQMQQGVAVVALEDVVKFLTMFIVTYAVMGQSSFDASPYNSREEWMHQSGLFVGSLLMYDILFERIVRDKLMFINKPMRVALNDGLKLGSVLILTNYANGRNFDNSWIKNAGGFTLGLMAYDYISERWGKSIDADITDVENDIDKYSHEVDSELHHLMNEVHNDF